MRKASARTKDAISREVFSLFKLGCLSSSGIVERQLKKLPGINYAVVIYLADGAMVNYDPTQLTSDEIREFLKKL